MPANVSGQPARPPVVDTNLDLTGEVCPFTFVRTKRALEALPIGGVLRVIGDHTPAFTNIPRSATEWGQEVVEVRTFGDWWSIVLRRRVR